jgi:hypothetical protein
MLASSTKTQIIRIASALTSSISLDSLRFYTLAKFENSKGGSKIGKELSQLHRTIKDTYPLSARKSVFGSSASITEHNLLTPYPQRKLFGSLSDNDNSFGSTQKLKSSYSRKELNDIRRDGERRVYFSRVPSPRHAISKVLRHDIEDMNNRKLREIADKESFFADPYKVTYFKDAYPALEKLPPIRFHYSSELLEDY